ncbi:MAG: 4-(cytidine 5'-diphospho)-2-C-methyl-D-erythritol kinase [Pirellulaceae bacterium]|nr:4-(cytidine 5'-diphospho)-2-C-methyl-D-erythritol kinase [Pirellulaceae bacterium]
MLLHRDDKSWWIVTPAKINLFLEVVDQRPDGFHNLDTVMLAVSLCDQLRFRPTATSGIRLALSSSNPQGFTKLSKDDFAWEIPTDSTNLVVRALESLRQRFGIAGGMEIELIKAIPAQAGLGGGSSNAAAAIVGGMLAWLGRLQMPEAIELASELGSDINFFIEGRVSGTGTKNWLAHCVGRGEVVDPISSDWSFELVVVHPPNGCSTKAIFDRLAATQMPDQESRSSQGTLQALERRDLPALAKSMFNRLEMPAAAETPWIKRIQEYLAEEPGVLGSCVSGSGSAVVAIVESEGKSNKVIERLRKQLSVRAFAVRSWQTPSISEQLATFRVD